MLIYSYVIDYKVKKLWYEITSVNEAVFSNTEWETAFKSMTKIYFTIEPFPNYINRISFQMKIEEI